MLDCGGLRAIIVLLLKQMHLQKDVAADLAPWHGLMRARSRISRKE